MSRSKRVPIVDLDVRVIDAMLERAALAMSAEDVALIKMLMDSLIRVTTLVREHGTTIARLRRLFRLAGSEKSRDLFASAPAAQTGESDGATPPGTSPTPTTPVPASSTEPKPSTDADKPTDAKVKGHGRVPASAYGAAEHIAVPHATLHTGARCPKCQRGKLYRLKAPSPIVRIFGHAPLVAKIWDCESLRCGACGVVHTARAPVQAHGPKHDETAAATLALLRYGAGMPFNRLEQLQRNMQIPVPSSTQWDLLDERVELVRPAYDELRRLAAQGSVVHNDDSYVRILAFMGKRRAALVATGRLPDPERTGLFTTAIVSVTTAGSIALFFTGRKHAGENLDDLLHLRDAALGPPIQMGDALTRNVPANHEVIEANCLAHGRRQFVDELANHPAECTRLIESLARVFIVDKQCKQRNVSDAERLAAHQRESAPVMSDLHDWIKAEMDQKRVEPNSDLGRAMQYLLKRWDKFTLFVRVPGAPLDNNVAERALKMAIKQRNASLFFRSPRGASVADVFMTLIHTAELHRANPLEYLTALQRHHKHVKAMPADWMPWTYADTLARLARPAA